MTNGVVQGILDHSSFLSMLAGGLVMASLIVVSLLAVAARDIVLRNKSRRLERINDARREEEFG